MTYAEERNGFTLLELMVVVTIVGILAAIALPAYQDSVREGMRSVARGGLLDFANRQTQFHINNGTYSDDLSELGYNSSLVFNVGGNSTIALNSNMAQVASVSPDRVYLLQIAASGANSFSVSAIPQLGQARDTECGIYSLDQSGTRLIMGSGVAADCW